MTSPLYHFKYKIDILYKLNQKLVIVYDHHNPDTGIINEGFHTYKTTNSTPRFIHPSQNIHEAYIPKGARYYYDPMWKEYVSDEIVIGKII